MSFSPADYSELLGLYLGDGHISRYARADRLRLALDSKYPQILDETEALLRRCMPENSIGRQYQHGVRMTIIWVYSNHLECLFPQHGPGPKHLRTIELESWQEELVEAEPFALLRGLIRSDGCSFINRTGPYEYLSFAFSNCSDGIAGIFVDACTQVGLECRTNYLESSGLWQMRINKRASVARLLETVGVKR